MTVTELQEAMEALFRECEEIHAVLLGKLGDMAADAGDDELEAGYREMARVNLWPTYGRKNGNYLSEAGIPGWCWEIHDAGAYYHYAHELPRAMRRVSRLTEPVFDTCGEALEAAARAIGKEITEAEAS